MKNKNEIAVKITDKNREKVKAILEMFGERVSSNTSLNYSYLVLDGNEWYGHGSLKLGDVNITEVKPKELKQILAIEKLKDGDYVVCKTGLGTCILKIKNAFSDIRFSYEDNSVHLNGDKYFGSGFCLYSFFKRYATKEEIEIIEGKKELQVGKWYKHEGGDLCLVDSFNESGDVYGYQISARCGWSNYTDKDGVTCLLNSVAKKSVKEATPKEVENALIKEAKNRGVSYGSYVFDIKENELRIKDIEGYCWCLIFNKGVWAEVIEVDKFAEQKEAHETGSVIQYKKCNTTSNWVDNENPAWGNNYEYRIKPEDKPKVGDVVKAWDNEKVYSIGLLESIDDYYRLKGSAYGFNNAKVLTPEQVNELLFKK